jgi:hypothetical protein
MEELMGILWFLITVGVVAVPAVFLVWTMASGDGYSVAELLRIASQEPRPRGVQEDEPVRWKLEHLHRPGSGASRVRASRPARHRAGLSAQTGR